MPNLEEKEKVLTITIKFKGTLDEEFEVRKALEQYISTLKLNMLNYKARVLSDKEISSLK